MLKACNKNRAGWLGFICVFLGVATGFLSSVVHLPGMAATVLFLGLEGIALVAGIAGRGTLQGKIAIAISASLLFIAGTEIFIAWRAR